MYEAFFGLTCKPFQLTPDPAFLFLGPDHRKALTHLTYGIGEHAGFILVTGEIGTGKTTLLKKIMREVSRDITIAHVNNTRISTEILLSMINDEFGIETEGKRKSQMLRDLQFFLIRQYAQNKRTTLIIDEAQNLSPSLLEEIRLLSNLETEKDKLLQIILIGQPELRSMLNRPEMRQLRQRISISCHINPFNSADTEAYIYHRLEQAGNRAAVEFQDGTIGAVHDFSRGIPRLINIAADFMLLTAFTQSTRIISPDLALGVIIDLESSNAYWGDTTDPTQPPPLQDIAGPVMTILDRLASLEQRVYAGGHRESAYPGAEDREATDIPEMTGRSGLSDAKAQEPSRQDEEQRLMKEHLARIEAQRNRGATPPSGSSHAAGPDEAAPKKKNFITNTFKGYWTRLLN